MQGYLKNVAPGCQHFNSTAVSEEHIELTNLEKPVHLLGFNKAFVGRTLSLLIGKMAAMVKEEFMLFSWRWWTFMSGTISSEYH